MPIKEQINRVNWMQFILSSITVSSLVCGGLVGAAKVWGDTIWVDEQQATDIATDVSGQMIRKHESSALHPSFQVTSDRLDGRYVLRREMRLILDQLSRIESKLE